MKCFITLCCSGIIAGLLLTSCSKDSDSDKKEDNQNAKQSYRNTTVLRFFSTILLRTLLKGFPLKERNLSDSTVFEYQ